MQETQTQFDSQQFRTTLGHYPTGVTVVTAIGPDGAPVGLTIGSFSSVSLTPPLIAFYPQQQSSSFSRLREATTFCVNILAEDQEAVCRAFASRLPDKFDGVSWHPSPTGAPILDGSIAWIDCTFDAIVESGDHFIVTGLVHDFAVERDRMPLLFFQGGYGSFLPRSLVAPGSDHIRTLMKTVDVARGPMEELASELGTGCLAASVVNGDILTLASTNRPDSHVVPAAVGQRARWAPPLGAMFVAWDDEAAVCRWLDRSKIPLTAERREQYGAALARVRTRGWSLALTSDSQRHFESAIRRSADGSTPDVEVEMDELIDQLQPAYEPEALEPGMSYHVRHIGAPIFDHTGHVILDLHLFGLPDTMTTGQIETFTAATTRTAQAITRSINGCEPTS